MNIDTGKIATEVGKTWRSNSLVVGLQILSLAALVFFAWDRKVTRETVVDFVNTVMTAQDQKSEALALRMEKQNSDVIARLNHLTDANQDTAASMTAAIVKCYEYNRQRDQNGGELLLPQLLPGPRVRTMACNIIGSK